jgi:hypothetical protein
MRPIVLVGEAYGHPNFDEGAMVKTGAIRGAHGRLVTVQGGRVYRLGEPDAKYRAWLKEHRPNWDPENPVKMLD